MGYVAYLVVMLIVAAISYQSAMRAQRMSQATAGTIDAPTAEEGRPVPVLFGTRVMKAPNVVWYGDVGTEPIQK